MLEKFTPEEIEQIKRELLQGGLQYSSVKGTVLRPFRKEVQELLPHSAKGSYYNHHQKNIVRALSVLCDYAFNNYDVEQINGRERITMRKHIPFTIQADYAKMMYELLDVAKKYNNK